MPRYWLLVIFLTIAVKLIAQNPHGEGLKMDCKACHTSDSWEIPMDNWKFEEDPELQISQVTGWVMGWDTLQFNHQKTAFPLEGQHKGVDCRACHESLVFAPTSVECISCHTDVHQQTVGADCARCHTAENWLVDNITELHQENGFPLLGMHAEAACTDCHQSETGLQFLRIGNECINCHLDEFHATTNPNHSEVGFSTDCIDCHTIEGFDWSTNSINHDFFPLTKGHEIDDCIACHIDRNFINTPTDCIACHETAFIEAQNPNHQAADFSTDCVACHTTDVGWQPAEFQDHDNLFPIYSGAHQGTWEQCIDCHNTPSDYSQFTCTNCHVNPETDEQHAAVTGYTYENSACLACHPTGSADDVFDHNLTNFPLTGAHIDVECLACHSQGYAGTPTDCAACHQLDFEQTTNPNHKVLNLSTDCIECHTTEPEWMPAKFDLHDQFWPLNGAHAAIANDCAACHNGNYTNTPTDCIGCHQQDFDNATDPNHKANGFSTDCTQCHTETTWTPSTFNHDQTAFPLTGAHIGVDCIDCHSAGYEGTPTDCAACHQLDFDQAINPNHQALNLSIDCMTCHTTEAGWNPATFDIHNQFYELKGAHAAVANDCVDCHNGDYNNTPNTCAGCHTEDYNQTTNPDHKAAQFPLECESCHTETAWTPSTFNHDQYYPLTGEHKVIENDCVACHQGDYENTPNTCVGCHQQDFDETVNPNHRVLNLTTDCTTCHTTDADWMPASFDIHDQFWPLNGAHAAIAHDCAACHNGDYTNTPTDCIGCHQQDFDNTTDPNHKVLGFPTDCIICHTETAWEPATFDHDQTNFPLRGAHATTDCIECHTDGYEGTPTDCFACHQQDFDNTTDPNHKANGFSTECTQCHTENAWEPSTFDHDQTEFPLTGAHIGVDCIDCHTEGYTNTPTDCAACHQLDFDQSINPNHKVLNLSTDCIECHTTEPDWMPASFDIHDQFWPLNGAHAAVANDCAACHNGDYTNTPTDCIGCHQQDFDNTTDPNHKVLGFPTDCTICHTETAWKPATFDHDQTNFPLRGAHTTTDCIECHTDGYEGTPTDCFACHQQDFDNTTDPNHKANGFSTECTQCHTETAWEPATFDHDQTNFPLRGAHATTDCIECHTDGYEGTPTDCFACHQQDFDNTTDPNHKVNGFSTECTQCHTENAWEPATFDHDQTEFPLTGAHIGVDCIDCHTEGYTNTPTDCAACHQLDFDQSINPNHKVLNLSTDCIECHTTEPDWMPASFDIHDQFWPLNGAHAAVANDCAACHNGNYTNTPTDCIGCHQQDFNNAKDPDHVASGFSTDCTQCHSEIAWEPATFDHDQTNFPLRGEHREVDCIECHADGYEGTPTDCFACHQADFNNTNDPDHRASGFPTDCTVCHTESGWEPATFDHDQTSFPLRGEHRGVDCIECHTDGYTGTPTDCVACHQADFDQTNDPNHRTAGFPTECTICHTESGWEPATFNHDQTNFPLRGAHATTDCIECHANGYEGTPTDCVACHQSDYNQTTNPNHRTAGFSTDCKACHTDETWIPATFDHDQTNFPLRGAHATTDCIECHANGYAGTPTECIACHQSDFNNAQNPNHQQAGFPMDCTQCHSEVAWEPSTFDHDAMYFPIYSGNHQSEWTLCSECHINNDFSTFSCIDCHEHNDPNQLADDHDGVNGYRFESNACYQCHPNGEED